MPVGVDFQEVLLEPWACFQLGSGTSRYSREGMEDQKGEQENNVQLQDLEEEQH